MTHTQLPARIRRGLLAAVVLLAARGESPAAFGRRCIPAALSATRDFHDGLLGVSIAGYPAPWASERASGSSPAGSGMPSGDRAIAHALNRLGFGPRPGDIERVRRIGLSTYIDQQLNPGSLADEGMTARLAGFRTLTKTTGQLAEEYFLPAVRERRARQQEQQEQKDTPAPGMRDQAESPPSSGAGFLAGGPPAPGAAPADGPVAPRDRAARREASAAMRNERLVMAELTQQKILRAVYSERQLEEVLVDFWFNHFNVFAGKGVDRLYLTAYERDTIRPHAMGRFRDLLGAVAESPAMLFYLDNWMSADPNGADPVRLGRQARAGLFGRGAAAGRELRPDPGSAPSDQAPARARPRGLNENYARELMELHTLGVEGGYTQADVGEVARAFTGWTLDRPRQGGEFRYESRIHDDREKIVLGHKLPSGGGKRDGEQVLDILARHPSTARFIAAKLVRRLVSDTPPATLIERAAVRFRETDGEIKEVVRTIVTSPEFFAPGAYRAKIKTPFEFIVSALRTTGARVDNAVPLVLALRQLGMPPYFAQPPTGYVDRADAWVNSGALLNRMNFAVALVGGELRGVTVLIPEPAQSTVGEAARQRVLDAILLNDVSDATRSTLARAADAGQLAALAIGSPEFQKR